MRKNIARHRAPVVKKKSALSKLARTGTRVQRVAAVTAVCGVAVSIGVAGQSSAIDVSSAAMTTPTESPSAAPSAAATPTAKASAAAPASATPTASKPAPAKTEAPAADTRAASSSVKEIPAPAPAVAVDNPDAAKAYAASILGNYGWSSDQMTCLTQLWTKESDWRTSATNPSSLAYGIAQSLPAEKMASTGSDWKTNAQTQIKWGLQYVKDRYGSPCGAWDHETSYNWY
ncbi:hypothetical protein KIH31_13200 [Paenarthrobacter sp. DKR-5]|uniref:aggregation-promoting factor C-terminal-like domain-containing protein n=1 Tax=Paenarthrobacter sp. DKR-5 TaxID=2835535 RepID=UPI001BDCAEF6|nr:hypothetical protein [Paenarthrobacter sp. DKR-5]MBT1003561.1 hypothetical protein [Paenarthrobacter sp. DKR-5]